jgi:hypothetical protein
MLDDLYWVMSYSRWKDERYWKAFHDALLREHPHLTEEGLAKAKAYNLQRYYYQGIGRYDPDAVMARGLADLEALARIVAVMRERQLAINSIGDSFFAPISRRASTAERSAGSPIVGPPSPE